MNAANSDPSRPRALDAAAAAANPHVFALLLMATHRAYLLDTFGGGHDSPERRANATAALIALWNRLLAE